MNRESLTKEATNQLLGLPFYNETDSSRDQITSFGKCETRH